MDCNSNQDPPQNPSNAFETPEQLCWGDLVHSYHSAADNNLQAALGFIDFDASADFPPTASQSHYFMEYNLPHCLCGGPSTLSQWYDGPGDIIIQDAGLLLDPQGTSTPLTTGADTAGFDTIVRSVMDQSQEQHHNWDKPQTNNMKQRSRYTYEQVTMLRNWVRENKDYPYMSREEKLEMSGKTGLGVDQIKDWLSKERGKLPLDNHLCKDSPIVGQIPTFSCIANNMQRLTASSAQFLEEAADFDTTKGMTASTLPEPTSENASIDEDDSNSVWRSDHGIEDGSDPDPKLLLRLAGSHLDSMGWWLNDMSKVNIQSTHLAEVGAQDCSQMATTSEAPTSRLIELGHIPSSSHSAIFASLTDGKVETPQFTKASVHSDRRKGRKGKFAAPSTTLTVRCATRSAPYHCTFVPLRSGFRGPLLMEKTRGNSRLAQSVDLPATDAPYLFYESLHSLQCVTASSPL